MENEELLSSPSPSPQPVTVVNEITVVLPSPTPVDDDIEVEATPIPEPTPEPTAEPYSYQSVDVSAVSSGRSGLVESFLMLLGDYKPQTVTTTVVYDDGSTVESVEYADGLAALDIPWIAAYLFFLMFFYAFLRIVGGMFRR